MPVTLRVSSHQSATMGSNAVRVFHNGGTIGRAPGNDWVLPDPERFVSGQHASLSLEGGAYFITDRSTNGLAVNGREIPHGGRVQLASGDTLTIGSYEIAVAIDHARDFGASGQGIRRGATPAGVYPDVNPQPGHSVDPLDYFGGAGSAAPPRRSAPGAVPDHAPPESEFFAPPPVRPPPARAVPPSAPPGGSALIPEDWDASGFDVGGVAPLPAANTGDPVRGAPAAPFVPERPETASPNATQTLRTPMAPAAGASTSGPDLNSVLRAAGLDPANVDEATLASLGTILKLVIEGLIDVLRARSAIKNQFRLTLTTLQSMENNPLKFSASADDALFNLFGRRNPSYLEPLEAFREVFDDLKAHQMAMMAGMRAAFGAMLSRFDPEGLEESFDKGLKRMALLDMINKTKYWDLYREMYAELSNDDATFRRLFGDEFAQAYEEQMQRLTALRKRQ